MVRKSLVGVIILTVWSLVPSPASGSGPFSERAIFSDVTHPDLPLENFIQGQLGVLQPTYTGPALYVAYRHLSGMGLSAQEQDAVLAVWKQWLGLEQSFSGMESVPEWLAARNQVPDAPLVAGIEIYRSVWTLYYTYLNCPDDAFRTATRTLDKRIEQFGADSPAVKSWLQAQDQVFANCPGGRTIPAAAPPTLHPLTHADRMYQIAAALFYAGDFDAAARAFTDIATDAASPWRTLAPYLVVRTLVRKATVDAGPGQTDWDTLAQAEAQLGRVLSDSALTEVHPAARRLLNYVRSMRDPATRRHEVSQALVRQDTGATLQQDLWDYLVLSNRLADQPGNATAKSPHQNALTDWLSVFRGHGGAVTSAWQKWHDSGSLAWLVAAFAHLQPDDLHLTDLLEEAAAVPPHSPAFLTLAFHRVRLLVEAEKKDEARALLETLLSSDTPILPPSSRNVLLAQRMQLARDLNDFLIYAPRALIGVTVDLPEYREMPVVLNEDEALRDSTSPRRLFDSDATRVLNGLPLDMLKRAAMSEVLPPALRREVTLTTWVRAALLEKEEVGKALVPVLSRLIPELTADLRAYRQAKTWDARQFAAILLILRRPGARPFLTDGLGRRTPMNKVDGYRDNWWSCPSFSVRTDTVTFLDDTNKALARQEVGQIPPVDTAFRAVLAWAGKHPTDPRIPEALSRAVKSARYGCTSERLSRQAFRLLHQGYPKSPWTTKTKYWYAG